MARHEGQEVYAFTRPGDAAAQRFARSLGAVWAGPSDRSAPGPLDTAIPCAPAGALVPAAPRAVDRGGAVVCAGIHMSDIPAFPYGILWHERTARSVADLARRDGEALRALAPKVPVRTATGATPLDRANEALYRPRAGALEGALVLVPRAARSGPWSLTPVKARARPPGSLCPRPPTMRRGVRWATPL